MESLDVRETCRPCTYAAAVILVAGFTMVVLARVPAILTVASAVVLALGATGAAMTGVVAGRRDWHVAGGFLLACSVSVFVAGFHL